MKMINLGIIMLAFCLIRCNCRKLGKEVPYSTPSINDTVRVTLNFDTSYLPESPFRIDSVIVIENGHLKFYNHTEYSATFIVPNSDKLFQKNLSYSSISVDSIQYLFIPVANNSTSQIFQVGENANPDTMQSAIYPFSAFCNEATQAAERNSSPIIIVRP